MLENKNSTEHINESSVEEQQKLSVKSKPL